MIDADFLVFREWEKYPLSTTALGSHLQDVSRRTKGYFLQEFLQYWLSRRFCSLCIILDKAMAGAKQIYDETENKNLMRKSENFVGVDIWRRENRLHQTD